MWLIARFDDAVSALKDQNLALGQFWEGVPEVGGNVQAAFPNVLNTDGLDHRRLRALVSEGFTPRFVESLRPRVRHLAHELIDAIEATGGRGFDLMEAFAAPLPIRVISDMLGLPAGDHERLRVWADQLTDDIGQRMSGYPESMEAFKAYLRALFEHQRARPGDDLVSAMVRAGEGGDALSERELIGMTSLLIFAGHETTVRLIGSGMLALLRRPDAVAELRARPELLAPAVEELLRLEGPATMTSPRSALADVRLSDCTVRAGELVVALASANRDETQFAGPDELHIARGLNRHLAFSRGVHSSLWAPLARLEVQEVIGALLERFPHLALNIDPRRAHDPDPRFPPKPTSSCTAPDSGPSSGTA
ncbi:cytochrome P450 [Deinococcus planocerae]|uniref:cytochrome P450 n=1 Tax=Deinococcus planocerae TaxID=1737569 RepID=UPI000C7EAE95|nr:cytochrome P450 [Deinococcus planocerae]